MKYSILAAISAFALIAAVPSFAEPLHTQTTMGAHADVDTNTTNAHADTKADMKAHEDAKNEVNAKDLIGASLYNNDKKETVGTIDDILVDANGKVSKVIVANGDHVDMGKKVAVNYNTITNHTDGKLLTSLTEEKIKADPTFSYENVKGFRLSQILKADIVNGDTTIGSVDNVTFKNGAADKMVIAYDKTMGMGGKTEAVSYKEAKLMTDKNDKDNLDVHLSQSLTQKLQTTKSN